MANKTLTSYHLLRGSARIFGIAKAIATRLDNKEYQDGIEHNYLFTAQDIILAICNDKPSLAGWLWNRAVTEWEYSQDKLAAIIADGEVVEAIKEYSQDSEL